MFEHRGRPLLSRREYLQRVAKSVLAGAGMLLVSLLAGMAGYHFFENLSWLDAYVNAAMILSGMGPLANPQTPMGKFFAGSYALYSGLLLVSVAAVMFAPVVHRFLHKFHLQVREDDDRSDQLDVTKENTAPGAQPGRRAQARRKPATRLTPNQTKPR